VTAPAASRPAEEIEYQYSAHPDMLGEAGGDQDTCGDQGAWL
jgi:hypothetical protein